MVAVLVQGVATAALILLGQGGASLKAAYDFLVAMSVLSYTLPFLVLFAVHLKVEARSPGESGRRRGALLIGVVGFATTALAVASTLAPSPDAADPIGAVIKLLVACGVLIASGVAFYLLADRRRRRLATPPGAHMDGPNRAS